MRTPPKRTGARVPVRRPLLLACACWAIAIGAAAAAESPPQPAVETEYPHGSFEGDCTQCHGPESWSPATIDPSFDHSDHGFALEGSHRQTLCRACHLTLDFADTDSSCIACHWDVHQNELGTDCSRCHTARSFIDRTRMVRDHLSTRFPLQGTHRVIDCEDCHQPVPQGHMQWVNTPVDCVACHNDEYLATSEPNHVIAGFDRSCENCHVPRVWSAANFNHDTLAPGVDCAACHLDDYDGTVDPDHGALGFSTRCQECHDTNTWDNARFDHDQLAPGVACVSCHLDDFNGTRDPDHGAAGFGQDCETCHSTTGWTPATFDGANHDAAFFPIYSGRHRNEWDTCTDCHMVPNNFAAFECIFCHEHDNAGDLADKHRGISGYQYTSQACYSCHPDGDE